MRIGCAEVQDIEIAQTRLYPLQRGEPLIGIWRRHFHADIQITHAARRSLDERLWHHQTRRRILVASYAKVIVLVPEGSPTQRSLSLGLGLTQ